MISQDDRPTDPDPRSPYEHVLSELNTIKSLCQATHDRVTSTRHYSVAASFVALAALLVACFR